MACNRTGTIEINTCVTGVVGAECEGGLGLSVDGILGDNLDLLRVCDAPLEMKIRLETGAIGVKFDGLVFGVRAIPCIKFVHDCLTQVVIGTGTCQWSGWSSRSGLGHHLAPIDRAAAAKIHPGEGLVIRAEFDPRPGGGIAIIGAGDFDLLRILDVPEDVEMRSSSHVLPCAARIEFDALVPAAPFISVLHDGCA